MKKYVINMLAIVCLVIMLGSGQASAQHFDYDEAYTILNGKWIDTKTGKAVYPVWKNKAGDCNISPNIGYTNPTGESKIHFDYKGLRAYMRVTYYPEENKYYGTLTVFDSQINKFRTPYECLVKEDD